VYAAYHERWIPQSLDSSLEEEALFHYVQDRLGTPFSTPHGVSSYLKQFLLHSGPTKVNSSLNSAIQAVSLAVFGRNQSHSTASSAATRKYVQALSETRLAILHPEQATTDQILLAVMLLNSYEVCTVPGNFRSFPSPVGHGSNAISVESCLFFSLSFLKLPSFWF
jgi:hypothetical protein